MKSRAVKLLVIWNVVLSTLVLILLGLYTSAAQAANDPPVQMYQAPQAEPAGGKGTTSTTPVDVQARDKWTLVQKLSVDFTGKLNHECVVIASTNASNAPGNSEDNKYEFILTLDDPNPIADTATARTIDFDNGRTVIDHNDMEVTASVLYHMTDEPHTFYWFAKKISENAATPAKMTAVNNTLSALCVKQLLH